MKNSIKKETNGIIKIAINIIFDEIDGCELFAPDFTKHDFIKRHYNDLYSISKSLKEMMADGFYPENIHESNPTLCAVRKNNVESMLTGLPDQNEHFDGHPGYEKIIASVSDIYSTYVGRSFL